MSNSPAVKKPKFSIAIQQDNYKNLINNTLQNPKRAGRFIASISSAVATNPALQECDAGTILSCALLGESLELSPSPQLGQYYLVPFNDNDRKIKIATFILGYKGYIQLAIRSGQYKKLNVVAIKKGELVRFDYLNEEIEINLIQDEGQREVAETIGYYAMFEYLNGFRKAMYWSKERMQKHALQYSAAYKRDRNKGTNYSFWTKDFDGMAYKTMLRQLISKWGIMSIEMRTAFESDNSTIKEDGTVQPIDMEPEVTTEIPSNPQAEPTTNLPYTPQEEVTQSNIEPAKNLTMDDF